MQVLCVSLLYFLVEYPLIFGNNIRYMLQGRRDGSTRDEPFAWQAREFLRKLCVGKVNAEVFVLTCRVTGRTRFYECRFLGIH